MKTTYTIAGVLLIIFVVVPVVLLAWAVSPWFLFGLALLFVLPIYIMTQQDKARRNKTHSAKRGH